MKIEHILSPDKKDIDFLCKMIDAEIPDKDPVYDYAFLIRDNDDKIIAGCNGFVFFGAIYIDQLWVHRDYRKQGLGKKLVDKVHEFGREAGCRMTTLSTMSFQGALGFYEKLGYIVDLERPGYVDESSLICLKKEL